ncbi:MAG: 1-acyl-sn-glycerol-3-phosphate acyltransferase, partial [Bdellovibrionia bacterium]
VKAQFSEKIPALEKDHFLIYASIHRSYLDSGILYAVLANHRMDFPLAVSADKMKKMWMGKLGAFAGVFFIQRKYVDEIYSAILSEHVNYLQKNAFSMEIFLEGQRSRSGLTLPPKKGIARMVWQNLEESSSKKVAIVPVSFSYSKLPESEALLKESFEERVKDGSATLRETADMMVKGTMRKSTFKKFRAGIRKLRSPGVSECLINFGDPIVLERSSVMDKKSSEIALQNYLNQVMFKINSMTSILPSSVLCLGISCADFYHMKALDALKFLEITKGILSAYHIEHLQDGLDQASFEEQLRSFLSLPFVNRKFKKVGIKNTPIVAMSDLDIERSSYYKNNIVHFFVLPGLLANVLMEYRQGRIEELNRFLGHMFNQLVIKYFLPLTMDSKIYIERCLEIFHRFHLVTLDDKLYNVNFECESINTLILLARFGDSLVQEDLFEIFESFRRSFKRIDLDAQAQFSVLKRNTALEGAVLRVSEEVFSLKCLELLEVGDEVQVVSSRQDSLSCVGTVVQASKETYELKQLPIQIGSELKDLPPLTPDSIQFKRAIHLPGDVKNISASGAFIVTEGNFRKGDLLIGELQNGNLRFQFEGMVTRIGKGAIGLRFENLTPEKQAELVLFTSKALAERKPLMEVA